MGQACQEMSSHSRQNVNVARLCEWCFVMAEVLTPVRMNNNVFSTPRSFLFFVAYLLTRAVVIILSMVEQDPSHKGT